MIRYRLSSTGLREVRETYNISMETYNRYETKITDMSKYKYNPKEHYSTLVTEVEEYIEIYSKPIKSKDLVRVIPDKELTNEEIGIDRHWQNYY